MQYTRKMIDCSFVLTAAQIRQIQADVFGRYIGPWSKCTNRTEINAILDAGRSIFLFWEGNPTYASYFSRAEGMNDARLALEWLHRLSVPSGVTICFTADLDAQGGTLGRIYEYILGAMDVIGDEYKVGLYGSFDVVEYVAKQTRRPPILVQTVAWSGGRVSEHADVYQKQDDFKLMPLNLDVDLDEITDGAGTWDAPTGETHSEQSQTQTNTNQGGKDMTYQEIPTVQEGSTDVACVKAVQAIVGVTTDGSFGPATTAAVKEFQTKHGLTVDGVVGPNTWLRLLA